MAAAQRKRLKAEMAVAHPNCGGTSAAFIEARKRYVTARRALRQTFQGEIRDGAEDAKPGDTRIGHRRIERRQSAQRLRIPTPPGNRDGD